MIYEFLTVDGRVVERDYPMARAPSIGSWVLVDGVRARRLPSVGQRPIAKTARHVAYTLPRKWMKKGKELAKIHDEWDSKGRALVNSHAEIDRLRGAMEAPGSTTTWDA